MRNGRAPNDPTARRWPTFFRLKGESEKAPNGGFLGQFHRDSSRTSATTAANTMYETMGATLSYLGTNRSRNTIETTEGRVELVCNLQL